MAAGKKKRLKEKHQYNAMDRRCMYGPAALHLFYSDPFRPIRSAGPVCLPLI